MRNRNFEKKLYVKLQHDVARVAARVADGPAGDFSFRDEGADVVFGRVGVDRDLQAFENAQEPVLVAKQPSEQPIERGVSVAYPVLARLKIRSKQARKSWACFTLGASL